MASPPLPVRIGVTGPDRGGLAAWLATRFALARAGARAVRITPRRGPIPADLDAFVIGGGADVGLQSWESPGVAGAPGQRRWLGWLVYPLVAGARMLFGRHQRADENAQRDRLELRCLAVARREGLPVLGICRGAQLINVFLGGRLHRDLRGFYEESRVVSSVLPSKLIRVAAGSRLAGWIGVGSCRVNALHRQAIDSDHLGDGLSVVAREPNGVVQAVESRDGWAIVGVQWHPEYLPQMPEQTRLFSGFVALAVGRNARR